MILAVSFLFGQELPKIIPPSPNAASLAQYADVPVNKYTGIPSISIPLYTLKSGKIELPLCVNYHASGIKVAQEASWVGLGWSLNAGGNIAVNTIRKRHYRSEQIQSSIYWLCKILLVSYPHAELDGLSEWLKT